MMPVPFARSMGLPTILMLLMVFTSGLIIGGNQYAIGEERFDFYDRVAGEAIEDGELAEQEFEPDARPQPEALQQVEDQLVEADLFPPTPRLDRSIESYLIVPLFKMGVRVAAAGYELGWGLASTVGVWSVSLLGHMLTIGMLGGAVWQLWRVIPR